MADQISAADTFVLVSGDADLAASLCFIRHIARKQTLVFNPHDMVCEGLRKYTSYFKIIPRDLPSQCELPDEVQAPHRIIRRPPEWCHPSLPNRTTMTDDENDTEIQRGLDSVKEINHRPVLEARAKFHKEPLS